MRNAEIVDADGKQIAKRKDETVREDVIIAAHGAGELGFRRPGSPAVGGSSVEGVPDGMIFRVDFSRVHPGDADIAGIAGCDGRETMLNARRGSGDIDLRRPAFAFVCGRGKIDALRSAYHRAG